MAIEKQRKTFLSYSRANKDFAIKLARELKAEGFAVWLDQLDIPPGSRWDVEVEKALDESEIFMIIMTQASIGSENVRDEIGFAIDNGKRFLPVLLENCTIPLRLRRFQYVDFTNKSFDEGVESAKELLRNLIEQTTILREDAPAISSVKNMQAADEPNANVKAEADRKANEEADRLAAQKAEADRKKKSKPVATPVAIQAEPVSAAGPSQKKSISKGLVSGILLVALIICSGIGYGAASLMGLFGVPATSAPDVSNSGPTGQWVIWGSEQTQYLVFNTDNTYSVESRNNSTNEVKYSGSGSWSADTNNIHYYDSNNDLTNTETYSLTNDGNTMLISAQDGSRTNEWTRVYDSPFANKPEANNTAVGPMTLNTLSVSDTNSLHENTKSLWSLAIDKYPNNIGDMINNQTPFEIDNPTLEALMLDGGGGCATTQAILDENLTHIESVFYFNDQRIPDSQIASYDSTTNDGMVCRSYFAIIRNLESGSKYNLEYTVTIATTINNGKEDTQPGQYIFKWVVSTP